MLFPPAADARFHHAALPLHFSPVPAGGVSCVAVRAVSHLRMGSSLIKTGLYSAVYSDVSAHSVFESLDPLYLCGYEGQTPNQQQIFPRQNKL